MNFCNMNVTEKQQKMLLDFMKQHEDLARGRLRYSHANKKILTWRDWKSNVLKKCANDKIYATGTGGGPPRVSKLSQLEEELLAVIGPESAGLQNIPEGGNFDRNVTTTREPLKHKTDTLISQQLMQEKRKYNSCHFREINEQLDVGPSSLHRMHGLESLQTRMGNDSPVIEPATEEIRIEYFFNDENMEMKSAENISSQNTEATSNKPRRTNAVTALDLMRDQLRIKREKLELKKEKFKFEKEKFEAKKKEKVAFHEILREMNDNLMSLRQEIEKMTPQYLE